jgi:tRNA(Ile)-lysidine synthase
MDGAGSLERRVADEAAGMPSLADGCVVLAMSGGADSTAMTAMLCESGVVDPRRCVAAHFDHRLRGHGAAAEDRLAVEASCARYGMEFVTGAWERPRAGEAAARDARYAFLRAVASRAGISVIVTGHTADDQAETVLMNALRGAGLHGLRGMARETKAHGFVIARPLLCVWRDETRGYCAARALSFVDDVSNDDRRPFRNRIRLEVLPRLECDAPEARAALNALAREARAAAGALDVIAAHLVRDRRDGEVELARDELRAAPPAVAAAAFRSAVTALLGDVRDFDRRHYTSLQRAAAARTGALFELPRGLVVHVDATTVVVSRGDAQATRVPAGFAASLPFEGDVGAWHLSVNQAQPAEGLMLPDRCVVRGRRPGDRMRLPGGTRKLQDVLVDRKVPRRLRDAMPVIAVDGEVLWTPVGVSVTDSSGAPYSIVARPLVESART